MQSFSVVVEDLDGDGLGDLVLGGEQISVARGRRDGTFEPPVAVADGNFEGFALGDYDGDGRTDLIHSHRVDATFDVRVLLGDGRGNFKRALTLDASNQAFTRIAVADLDGDGRLDVVGVSAGAVQVLSRSGSASYPIDAVELAIADVTGDGRPDVVVSQGRGISVFANLGASLAAPVSYPATGAFALALADVDRDGALDALVGTGTSLAVLHNDGSGGFGAPPELHDLGAQVSAIAVADLDRDGNLDVGVASEGGLAIFRGAPDGTLTAPLRFAPLARRIAFGDLDGDGFADLILHTSRLVTTYRNTRTPALFETSSMLVADQPGELVRMADLDHDGRLDLLGFDLRNVRARVGGQLTSEVNLGIAVTSGAFADVDGDGTPDLVIYGQHLPRWGIQPILGYGDGTLAAAAPFVVPPGSGVVVADFDGDGLADAVTAIGDRQLTEIRVHRGRDRGQFDEHGEVVWSGAGVAGFFITDLDGDGRGDLIVDTLEGPPAGARQHVLVQGVRGLLGERVTPSQSRTIVAARDFNGDGNPDLFSLDGASFIVSLGGGGGALGPLLHTPHTLPRDLAFADFDGDGYVDIATAGDVTAVHRGRGDGTFEDPLLYDVAGSVISAGDFDGDGLVDLLVDDNTTAPRLLLGRCL
ncbi:MAG: VCBS repeat-containing protein [Deltaproteobacteria bacterium]|nr:VCBS repeat-containing protein [Deltaproteobacteria bacterium]